jgi:2-hydroxychromene-2-carboxylate isomerase
MPPIEPAAADPDTPILAGSNEDAAPAARPTPAAPARGLALAMAQKATKSRNVDPMGLAVRLGLSRADFKRCLESHATSGRIAVDVREAMTRKLTGTPSFLVGERLFVGRIPEADLEQQLQGTP